MLIDTHAHLNFKEFDKEILQILNNAENADVKAIINVGSNFETSKKAVEIARVFSCSAEHENNIGIFASIGVHPIHLVKDIVEEAKFDGKVYKFKTKKEEFDYERYRKLAKSSDKVVAIGETGLDYFRFSENNRKLKTKNEKLKTTTKNSSFVKSSIKNLDFAQGKQIQKQVFEEHIRLAEELKLPLILHCRGSESNPYDAYDEMLEILKSKIINHKSKITGVIHCFGGNLEQAKEFIKLGFYVGITGIVTFKNAIELQNIVQEIPLEKTLIETDCPFLAPVPYRGKRNEPAYVVEVARKIAELKNIPLEEVEKTTTQNAQKLFKI